MTNNASIIFFLDHQTMQWWCWLVSGQKLIKHSASITKQSVWEKRTQSSGGGFWTDSRKYSWHIWYFYVHFLLRMKATIWNFFNLELPLFTSADQIWSQHEKPNRTSVTWSHLFQHQLLNSSILTLWWVMYLKWDFWVPGIIISQKVE